MPSEGPIKTLILHADSILKHGIVLPNESLTFKKSNSELSLSLENLLSISSESEDDEYISHDCIPSKQMLRIPQLSSLHPFDNEQCGTSRSTFDVMAKFFYLQPSSDSPSSSSSTPQNPFKSEWLFDALDEFHAATGIEDIDTLILSFPHFLFDEPQVANDDAAQILADAGIRMNAKNDAQAMQGVMNVWKDVSESTKLHKLGVSEFSVERMKSFLSSISPPLRRPSVDQINLRDCCSIPPALTDLSKQENIELLTHSDCSDLLPQQTLIDIFSNKEVSQKLPPSLKDLNKSSTTSTCQTFTPCWVLKYTVVDKDRSVVADKGYIVMVEASST